jgi:hypothetical protein
MDLPDLRLAASIRFQPWLPLPPWRGVAGSRGVSSARLVINLSQPGNQNFHDRFRIF